MYCFKRAFLLAITSISFAIQTFGLPPKNGKPNVIYILADDLGYGELGSYGQTKIKTPNLDKLASEGLRFTQFYVGTPVCAPSRCNLLTGRNAGHAYIRGNYGLPGYKENVKENGSLPIPGETQTIGNLFKKAGYATGAIGKWGLGNYDNSGDPLKHGFDYFYGYYDQRHAHNYYTTHLWENGKWDSLHNPAINVHPKFGAESADPLEPDAYKGKEYAIDKMTAKAVQFIRQHSSQNFFLYLPFTLPHAALQVPENGIKEYITAFGEQPHYTKDGYVPTYFPRATYAAMISYLDRQVGVIQQLLKQLNLEENTIVIFTSDNGTAASKSVDSKFFNSVGGLRGLKQDLYEGGIREPFIVKWPGKTPVGKVTDYIATNYDILATFADVLQVDAPRNDGFSILPALTGRNDLQQQHEYFYWEYPAKGGQLAIRMGDWKGIKTGLFKNQQAQWELYDLKSDPAETHNIAQQYPDRLQQFDAIVKKEHVTPVREEWDIFNANHRTAAGEE